jgi:CBS domain containing-hemolysin-like protein
LDDPYSAALITSIAALGLLLFSAFRQALEYYGAARLEKLFRNEADRKRFEGFLEEYELLLFATTGAQSVAGAILVLGVFGWVAPLVRPDTAGSSPITLSALIVTLVVSVGGVYLLNQILLGPVVRWRAEHILYHGMRILWPSRLFFLPVFRLQTSIIHAAARLFGRDPDTAEGEEIVDDLHSAAEEGEKEGILSEGGTRMIKRIIKLQQLQVEDVMKPRIDIVAVPVESTIDEAAGLALQQGHSRIPVYRENMDKVVGILYVKDLLGYWKHNGETDKIRIADIMRKPIFIPESKPVLELLREFRRDKTHMAIVLDEYGGTAGLVTIEDILEEIVGEIEDEHDRPSEVPLKMVEQGRVADVDAKIHIDEVNDALKIAIPESDDFETIGGFIFSTLGKIPDPGESFVHGNVKFTIVDAGERRINRVTITVLDD